MFSCLTFRLKGSHIKEEEIFTKKKKSESEWHRRRRIPDCIMVKFYRDELQRERLIHGSIHYRTDSKRSYEICHFVPDLTDTEREREREREIYRFDYGSCTVLSFFFFLEKVQFWVWDCVRQIKWKTKHTDEIAVQVYKRKGVQFSAISVKITNILYLYLCDVVWYHSLQIFEKRNFQYFLWQRNISLLQFPKGNYFCNLILLYEITILTLSRSNY